MKIKKTLSLTLAVLLLFGSLPVAASAAAGFSDVSASAYYVDAVEWAVESGITSGTGNGKFSPNAGCTRAQAVTFLWRAAGSPYVGGSTGFSDVSASAYYADAVKWAVQNGITEGTGSGRFSPNSNCTRAQIVTFQYRAAGSPSSSTGNSFNDVSSGAYYAKAVSWAIDNGITSGTGNGKFSPNSICTRAQIVTFLYRQENATQGSNNFSVTDAYFDAVWFEDYKEIFCYHIPEIEFSDNRCAGINSRIYTEMYGLLEDGVYSSEYPSLSEMAYSLGFVSGMSDIATIVVKTHQIHSSWTEYYTYYISLDTGKEAAAEDLLVLYGYTESDFYELVRDTLQEYWQSREEDLLPTVGKDIFYSLVEQTLAEENVEKSVPYINSDGDLCFIAGVYSPAGAEYYYHLFNTYTEKEENDIECTVDHSLDIDRDDSTSSSETIDPSQNLNIISISERELLGEWTVDTEYTMQYNDMSMWDIYGSSFSDGGNKMTFKSDGSFDYYVAWCYGKGSFELNNGKVTVDLKDGDPIQGSVEVIVTSDGITRIALGGDDIMVFWVKS